MVSYNPQKIEKKWQKNWEKRKTLYVDLKKARKPYYNLMMFPYPSAEGLHVGNVYAFTGSDIYGRFRRLQGFDVFEPMGYDAFGIHSENFAIKKGIHPKVLIKKNTDNFRRQLKSLGCLFDWRHEINTTNPDYYKWTQWLFLQLFKAGLAYKKKAPVDWCPSCKTVLADEQVISGKCERCDSEVVQKETEQWFFKITKYADKLLKNLETIDWSERTKIAQKNWIGKSEGAEIEFPILPERKSLDSYGTGNFQFSIKVFTTRPDTLFGVTYLVVAPEHEIILNLKDKILNQEEVMSYIEQSKRKTDLERTDLIKEKTGVELKGVRAINPADKETMPIFVADYVLPNYGTGAIMAVPAHDQRDFDFAKKYNLPIKVVISKNFPRKEFPVLEEAYKEEGFLVDSAGFTGMDSKRAREEIIFFVGGKKTTIYHLRDWLISRQRYWGPPIPIIYCKKCGVVPVPEKDLPVLLPYAKDFKPTGTGKSPLASIKDFVDTKCPKCKGVAERETDVSDTFLDSAWYFLRYPCTNLKKKPFDKLTIKKWLPVNMYIGGQEHAVLHLLYTRFITMVLKDLNLISFEEPFKKFRAHGLLTKGGAKMSKSKGNVVNPDDYYEKYGADTLRMYLMFLGPFSEGGDWQDQGVLGIKRFLDKVWGLKKKVKKDIENNNLDILANKTIKKVTEDLENLRYNTAISALMIFSNELVKGKNIPIKHYQFLLILLAPFAPHITEEIWREIGQKGSIHNKEWPNYNENLVKNKTITLIVQINGRVRDKIEVSLDISEEEARILTLASEKVKKWVDKKEIKRVIFVPGKLINIVI